MYSDYMVPNVPVYSDYLVPNVQWLPGYQFK